MGASTSCATAGAVSAAPGHLFELQVYHVQVAWLSQMRTLLLVEPRGESPGLIDLAKPSTSWLRASGRSPLESAHLVASRPLGSIRHAHQGAQVARSYRRPQFS